MLPSLAEATNASWTIYLDENSALEGLPTGPSDAVVVLDPTSRDLPTAITAAMLDIVEAVDGSIGAKLVWFVLCVVLWTRFVSLFPLPRRNGLPEEPLPPGLLWGSIIALRSWNFDDHLPRSSWRFCGGYDRAVRL